jgi:hypothetical protein
MFLNFVFEVSFVAYRLLRRDLKRTVKSYDTGPTALLPPPPERSRAMDFYRS